MAAELDFSTGQAAIAYTGKVPWHGFGHEMPEDQTLDQWRVAAGLDWSVIPRKIKYRIPTEVAKYPDEHKFYDGRVVLLRDDSYAPLSIVSTRFKVVQPAETLDFFKSLIEKNGFKMCTAGSLRGGRRIWAMADTGKAFSIGNDQVEAYMLLATAYDGTFATTAQFTSIRVVCNNTLEFSLNGSSSGCIKVPHTQDFNAVDVKVELGLEESWGQFRDNVLQLASLKVTKQQAIDYFLTVCGVTEDEAADGKQLSNVKKLISYYERGPGATLPSAKGTAWGLVNAVTYLADHGRRAKDNGTRFDSASFGSGAVMKRKAMEAAVAMAA